MKQTEQVDTFEQVLLSYTEMCYSVALALTRNPGRAQNLTRNVLTWAWHLRGSTDGEKNIKKKLLIAMRKTFLKDYGLPPCDLANDAMRAENAIYVARDA
jgi:DNA-directed RNA polymerase specialized sigma24 family protein